MIGIMFRTRDFAIMLSVIAFLLVGITLTWSGSLGFSLTNTQGAAVFTAVEEEVTYSAVVPEANDTTPYAERIADLKKKIAAQGPTIAMAEPVVETTEPEPDLTPAVTENTTLEEQKCSSYSVYAGSWKASGLLIEEVEGARLVYRPGVVLSATASGTLPAIPPREIVLQLPVRNVPSATQQCISSDVIGVAKDGSLIRNSEASVYQVFGSETLVGYALDGFPIYGKGNSATDACGGLMVAGQYRYQLSADRDTILNCFAGSPVTL
jgi:hypothetical protein